jgi:hypothetical protein
MPYVPFEQLPDDSRIWIFGSDRPITGESEKSLLAETDRFLQSWAAHGSPLTCSRDWKESRFLTIAADQSTAGASGCSIDGLFRTLSTLGARIGANLVGSGRIFYRDQAGAITEVSRDQFADLGASGAVMASTPVFDTTLQTLGDWRRGFEKPLAASWHAQLLPEGITR